MHTFPRIQSIGTAKKKKKNRSPGPLISRETPTIRRFGSLLRRAILLAAAAAAVCDLSGGAAVCDLSGGAAVLGGGELKEERDAVDDVVHHQADPAADPAAEMATDEEAHPAEPLLAEEAPHVGPHESSRPSQEALREGAAQVDGFKEVPAGGDDRADDALGLAGGELGGLRAGLLGVLGSGGGAEPAGDGLGEGSLDGMPAHALDVGASDGVDVELHALLDGARHGPRAHVEAVQNGELAALGCRLLSDELPALLRWKNRRNPNQESERERERERIPEPNFQYYSGGRVF